MISPKHLLSTLLLTAGMGLATTASAQLFSRAGGTMVYDSDLNITWLADANYAATQYAESCGELGTVDGKMDFLDATKWVSGLVYKGVSGWRLPKSAQPDASCERQTVVGSHGFYCTGSEMGHLFYGDIDHGLGGVAGENITRTHNENFNLFRNFSSFGVYWYISDFPTFPFISRNFQMRNGFSNAYSKSVLINAWPVHDGDVGSKINDESPEMENHPRCNKKP